MFDSTERTSRNAQEKEPMPQNFKYKTHTLRRLFLALLSVALCFLLLPSPAFALSDAQQLVIESWRFVNEGYLDPSRFEQIQWRRLRKEALEKPIFTSEDAYKAIEEMLLPIGDPYTRLLRPDDYAAIFPVAAAEIVCCKAYANFVHAGHLELRPAAHALERC